MKKRVLFYIITVIIFGSLLLLTLEYGRELEINKLVPNANFEQNQSNGESSFFTAVNNFLHNFQHPLAILILQILSIILHHL